MAAVWTDVSDTSTADYKQLEPQQGFGQNPFGNPDTDKTISIHERGFGDPKTEWSDV